MKPKTLRNSAFASAAFAAGITLMVLSGGGKLKDYYFPIYNGPRQPNNIFMRVSVEGRLGKVDVEKLARKLLSQVAKLKDTEIKYGNRFFVTPSEIERKGAGQCLEKTALLLKAFLEHGLDAEPKMVKIIHEKRIYFHSLVVVRHEGKEYWVDPEEKKIAYSAREYFDYLLEMKKGTGFLGIEVYAAETRKFPKLVFTDKGELQQSHEAKPELTIIANPKSE